MRENEKASVTDRPPAGDLFAQGVWAVARSEPDRPAVVGTDGSVTTFGELVDQAHRYAHGWRSMGLRTGDAVAVMSANRPEMIALYLSAIESGLYFTAVNFHLVAEEVTYILTNSGSRALVVDGRFAEVGKVAADAAQLEGAARFAMDPVPGWAPLARLAEDQPATLPTDAYPGEFMSYTSGSTGRPKGVRRPLGNGDVLATFHLTAQLTLGGSGSEGTHLVCGPLYFRGPFMPALVALHLGHRLVLMDRWTPEGALALIEQYRVTTTYMVPTMFHRLLGLPPAVRDGYDVSSLRYLLHSAAPCPVAEKRAIIDWLGPFVHETYGGTEGGGTYVSPEEWLDRPGTVGRAWPGAEIHVLDAEGRPCPTGVSGTVYIRPTSPTFAYHQDPEKTAAAKQGPLHTIGDLGFLDAEGYLFLHGRRSDLVLSGGVNVYPAEIEGALLLHPAVEDVAVFGIPDAEWGERVHALVVPRPGFVAGDELAEELLEYCREHLAGYKCPRSVEWREALPRTSAGKLNKPALQAPYWADLPGH